MTSYEPPPVFSFVSHILNPLRAEYSRDIAGYIVSGGSTDDNNYRAGLVFLSCVVGGIAAMWGFVLVVLKCKGRPMGCAAGYAVERGSDEPVIDSKSFAVADGKESCTTPVAKLSQQKVREAVLQSPTKEESADDDSSIPSNEFDRSSIPTDDMTMMSEVVPPTPRERRIRVAFLIFTLIAIACVPLVLVFTFAPLKSTTTTADAQMKEIREAIYQVQESLRTVASAANISMSIVESFPQNLSAICPMIYQNETSRYFAFDLDTMIHRIQAYSRLEDKLQGNISAFQDAMQEVDAVAKSVDVVYSQAGSYIWLIPGVLLALCTLLSIALFAVVVAWRQNSTLRLQRILSYGILPLFIVVTIACWTIAIVAAITTSASSDVCMYGTSPTSPDQMFESLLTESHVSNSSYLYRFAIAYTNDCQGEDPSELLTPAADRLEETIHYIWTQLSLVEAAGRSNIVALCGSSNLNDFLAEARDLAVLLTSILKAVESAKSSLSCDNINSSYMEIVHGSICTDTTSAVAWGFLFFFIIGMSTLGMLTLRSAWRHPIREERLFDESEIDENMLVDEHEEYLAYISKYKHEWQEYNGFDGQVTPHSRRNNNATSNDRRVDVVPHLDSRSFQDSQESPYSQGKRAERESRFFDPYQGSDGDGRSLGTEISFPSLREPPAELTEEEYLLRKHSSMLLSYLDGGSEDVEADLLPSRSLDNTYTMSAYSLPPAIRSGVSGSIISGESFGDVEIDPTLSSESGDGTFDAERPRIIIRSPPSSQQQHTDTSMDDHLEVEATLRSSLGKPVVIRDPPFKTSV